MLYQRVFDLLCERPAKISESDRSEPLEYRSWKLPNGCISTSIEEDTDQANLPATGNNATIEKIDSPLFSVTSGSFPFLRRNVYGEFGSKYNRIAIWASNEGVVLRVHRCNFLSDASTFLQYMIIMGFDPTSNVYVPHVWALMSAKDEDLYCKYHYLTEVSLVAKAYRSALRESVAKLCMLSVHRHKNNQMLLPLPTGASSNDDKDQN
ncbi:hypothetical protein MXB_4350 [Myxobolus squamalis]|nr:hypothetical protein MXB_4350 [Myxobolus squamalis]